MAFKTVYNFNFVSLSEFGLTFNPIWQQGHRPNYFKSFDDLVCFLENTIESVLLPLETLDNYQSLFDLPPSIKKKITLQMCIGELDKLNDLKNQSDIDLQLWTYRPLTTSEWTFLNPFTNFTIIICIHDDLQLNDLSWKRNIPNQKSVGIFFLQPLRPYIIHELSAKQLLIFDLIQKISKKIDLIEIVDGKSRKLNKNSRSNWQLFQRLPWKQKVIYIAFLIRNKIGAEYEI